MQKTIILIASCLLLMTISCSKTKEDPKGGDGNTFDKSAMLVNYADNHIIPAYFDLNEKVPVLESSVEIFLTSPNSTNQQALKSVFRDTYLTYEKISCLHFGPAENILLNNFINMLPANTMKKDGIDKPDLIIVEENIISGNYNLQQNSTLHQQGFPVLDYLLFSSGAIEKFSASNATNRKKYVRDLLTRIKTLLGKTLDDWKNGYRTQFTSNTKSDSGSPISFMVNQLAFEMDMMKGPRIGWPFGSQSGGTPYPEKCEGYYSGISLELAIANIESLKKIFTASGSGKGFSDLLKTLGKEDLSKDVIKQFDLVIAKLKVIPAPLSSSLINNRPLVTEASKEIQNLLTLIKTDVTSALGVQISYIDNDGD